MNLRTWYTKNGMNSAEVSRLLGASVVYISRLCTRKESQGPSDEMCMKIVALTNGEVGIDDLYDFDMEKEKAIEKVEKKRQRLIDLCS